MGTDCVDPQNECLLRTCNVGVCGTEPVAAGTPLATQVAANCKRDVCDGAGAVTSENDNADLEDDANDCTDDTCNAGAPVHTNKAVSSPCGAGGSLFCNGAGMCVGCITEADCAPPAGDCAVAACTNSTCGAANKPNGTACNDGSACTQTDTCQAGTCAGANPVVCATPDQCHNAGTCDPGTGVCDNPTKPNGAGCNDGSACTQTDTCQAGMCAGANPVVCAAPDQCHNAGTCDPGTGVCDNPTKPDGDACNDGSACTQADTCQAGTCAGGNPVVCQALDACHDVGTCNPGTGVCSDPNKMDGTACVLGAGMGACGVGVCIGCGDGDMNAPEECDDGNALDGDGCSDSCKLEFCSDGKIQYALGELCDDGGTAAGDGCSATCQIEATFQTVPPVLVSGALTCTTASSNTGRKVAVDQVGTIYVTFRCSDGGGYVVRSTDLGVTYSAPLNVFPGANELAIAAGPTGTVYLVGSAGPNVGFTRSTDSGASWSPITTITMASSNGQLSIDALGNNIMIGTGSASGVAVFRNGARGVGSFDLTDVAIPTSYFDLIYDDQSGDLLVCTDTPDFHIRTSINDGVSFGPELNPSGLAFFSDWASGNGTIYASGVGPSSDSVFVIPANNPGQASAVTGLPVLSNPQSRALNADANGTLYVVSRLNNNTVELDRLLFGAPTVDAVPRAIAPGISPHVSSLPTLNGTIVVYENASQVYATVQVY